MKKIAVVGYGKMGMLHGALVNLHPDSKLVAVCEKGAFTRSAFKTILSDVHFYANYNEMLDKEELDAVVIATPTFNHYEIAIEALKRNVAVFCEKPLALNGNQAFEMSDCAAKSQVPSMVGFSNRFYPTIIEGKKRIVSGDIGKIISADAKMYIGDVCSENSGWRYNPIVSGGGVLIDFGIHMIDLLLWYFGDVSTLTNCYIKKIYSKEVEDEAGATLVFKNGVKVVFECSWSRAEYRKASPIIYIHGEKGEILVTEQTIEIYKDGEKLILTHPDLYRGSFADIAGINYSLEIERFIEILVRDDLCNDIDFTRATVVQQIVDKIYSSARNK